MEKLKKSPIQLEEISLVNLTFSKTQKLRRYAISERSVRFEAAIEQVHELADLILFTISVNDENDSAKEFYLKVQYQIIAKTADPAKRDELGRFSKLAAPFNAMVHARELISGLTSKAFGRALLLPLFDIRDFEQRLTVTQLVQQPGSPSEKSVAAHIPLDKTE